MVISFIFELIVMGLLATTIAYCYILNTRLRRLRSEENALRASIAQLFNASQKVETAVKALKSHNSKPLQALQEQSEAAEEATIELTRQMSDAKKLITHLQGVLKTAKSKGMTSDVLLDRNQRNEAMQAQKQMAMQNSAGLGHNMMDKPQMPQQRRAPQPQPQPQAYAQKEFAPQNGAMMHEMQIAEPQRLKPNSQPANYNLEQQWAQQNQSSLDAEYEAINRLEKTLSQFRKKNGRAA